MTSYAKTDTLIGAALSPMDMTRTVSIVIAFSLFNAIAAQLAIPIGPVPITMQTFAVTLTGALLGPRLGAAALITYLIEGAVGLPFFAEGRAGIGTLLGPTGGYLVSFPAAAYITGAFSEHGWDRHFLTAVAAMAIGSVVILLAGWSWLVVGLGAAPLAAFKAGVAPFLIGDVVKIVLAAAVLPTGWALLKRKASGH
ncbi:MAG TPA: biotin transporter BioY [Pyrinomonadaceae bacterium]|nr:biotin transporter BioY [Pyrinomonadaceae bacterium]